MQLTALSTFAAKTSMMVLQIAMLAQEVIRCAKDIGRIDGGFISSRLAAFGAALVTPVLLEFGALKWLLERPLSDMVGFAKREGCFVYGLLPL